MNTEQYDFWDTCGFQIYTHFVYCLSHAGYLLAVSCCFCRTPAEEMSRRCLETPPVLCYLPFPQRPRLPSRQSPAYPRRPSARQGQLAWRSGLSHPLPPWTPHHYQSAHRILLVALPISTTYMDFASFPTFVKCLT